MSAPLLRATPRALLYIEGALGTLLIYFPCTHLKDYNKDVIQMNETRLSFWLCTFDEMKPHMNLLRPNELVGEHDPVAGTTSS